MFPCQPSSCSVFLVLVLGSLMSQEETERVISRLARKSPTATLGDIPGDEKGPHLGDSLLGAGEDMEVLLSWRNYKPSRPSVFLKWFLFVLGETDICLFVCHQSFVLSYL